MICIYSPQKNDSVDQLDGFYEAISSQITRGCLAGDFAFLVGDFNAKLGRQFISGDIHDISGNGKRLLNIVKEFNLDVLNSSQKCTGIFTRVINKNPDEKSVFDYVIVSGQLEKYVNYMRIDQQKLFTPWRTLKQGKRFSDHNAILVDMSLPVKKDLQVSTCKTTWNFSDPSGWDKFEKMTSGDAALIDCWKDSSSVGISYQIWVKRLSHLCISVLRSVGLDLKNYCILRLSRS